MAIFGVCKWCAIEGFACMCKEKYPRITACVIVVSHNRFQPRMSCCWVFSPLELDYVLHTDFLWIGMTQQTNSTLGTSKQALTQVINNPGMRACIVVVCHNKFKPAMIWNWFVLLLDLHCVSHTDFLRMGMTARTHISNWELHHKL